MCIFHVCALCMTHTSSRQVRLVKVLHNMSPQRRGTPRARLCRVKSGGHTLVLVVCWSVHTHAHRTSHNHCLSMVVVFTSRKPRMVSVKTYDVLHELERQKDSGGSCDERMFLGILVALRRKSKEGVIRG